MIDLFFGTGQLWLPIGLLLLGAVVIFFEIFIPSGGMLAFVAFVCIVAANVLVFRNNGTNLGFTFVVITLLLVPIVIIFAMKIFPQTSVGRRLILSHSQTPETGYSGQDASENELLGKTGVTLSVLRPVGIAKFGTKRIDVMTDGEMIDKDRQIEVHRVEGNRIIVREVKEAKTENQA